jgi:hypothetical protein
MLLLQTLETQDAAAAARICCRCILQSAVAYIYISLCRCCCCRRSRRNTPESSSRQQRCELQHRQNQNHIPVYDRYQSTLGVQKGPHHPRIIQELGSEYRVACGCAVPLRRRSRHGSALCSTPPLPDTSGLTHHEGPPSNRHLDELLLKN